MAELKTKQTDQPVEKHIEAIADKQRQADCWTIIDLMKKITGDEPKRQDGKKWLEVQVDKVDALGDKL